jgi:hypothetical protein
LVIYPFFQFQSINEQSLSLLFGTNLEVAMFLL